MRVLTIGRLWRLAGTAGLIALFNGSVSAVTIDVGSGSTTPGGVIEIPITMTTGPNEAVAATQNDIVFDPTVVTIARGSCRINPDIGPGSTPDKTFNVGFPSANTMRVIIISTGQSNPIPAGILYTCAVRVGPDAPDGSSVISNTNLGAATPKGTKLPVSGASGEIFVSTPGGQGNRPGMGSQPQLIPGQPGRVAPAPAAPVRPAAPALPAGAPPLPAAQPQPQLEEAPGLPTLNVPATTTPAAIVTRALATATPGAKTATPAKTAAETVTPVATVTGKTATPHKKTPTPKPAAAND